MFRGTPSIEEWPGMQELPLYEQNMASMEPHTIKPLN